jgi:YHS domain-containing protein
MKTVNKRYLIRVDERSKEKIKLNNGKELYADNSIGTVYMRMPYWGVIESAFDGSEFKEGDEVGFFHMVLRRRKKVNGVVYYSATEQDIICSLNPMKAASEWLEIEKIEVENSNILYFPKTTLEKTFKVKSIGSIAKELQINVCDEIITTTDADYMFERRERTDFFCRKKNVVYNLTQRKMYNNVVLLKALDDDDEMEQNEFGIYLKSNIKKTKSKAVVIDSYNDEIPKDAEVIYNKRGFMKIEIDGNEYYACPESEIKFIL